MKFVNRKPTVRDRIVNYCKWQFNVKCVNREPTIQNRFVNYYVYIIQFANGGLTLNSLIWADNSR